MLYEYQNLKRNYMQLYVFAVLVLFYRYIIYTHIYTQELPPLPQKNPKQHY